ncbi:hypothetical protein B9Z55_011884 [Caenorhabditis nigoni]|uniref:Uncharacterized protein n=1 Tax=Caenorhabditis nigoni TaxID=1611254 RepID=A0A2G5UM53_9PELO|nr:hypothetical protein B9Z55_011884 [Caenorhabditis nigoni]
MSSFVFPIHEKTFRANNIGPTHFDLKSCNDRCSPMKTKAQCEEDGLDESKPMTIVDVHAEVLDVNSR